MNRPVEWVSARAAELFGRDWTQQPPDATVVVQFPVVDLARRFTCPSGFRCVAMVAAAFAWRWLRWLLESMRGLHRRSRRRRCCSQPISESCTRCSKTSFEELQIFCVLQVSCQRDKDGHSVSHGGPTRHKLECFGVEFDPELWLLPEAKSNRYPCSAVGCALSPAARTAVSSTWRS